MATIPAAIVDSDICMRAALGFGRVAARPIHVTRGMGRLNRRDDRVGRKGFQVVPVHHLSVFNAPTQVIDPAEQVSVHPSTRRTAASPIQWVATWKPAALVRLTFSI